MDFVRKVKNNWKRGLLAVFLFVLAGSGIFYLTKKYGADNHDFSFSVDSVSGNNSLEKSTALSENSGQSETGADGENLSETEEFRDQAMLFVRKLAEDYFGGKETQIPKELEIEISWKLHITLYHKGQIKGEGIGEDKILGYSLKEAVRSVFEDKRSQELNEENLNNAVFLVEFGYPESWFSFVGFKDGAKEIVDDIVPVRELDKELIYQKVKEGKEFLYRMENKEEHGFYKKYDALNDHLEPRLHTVYSASIIYTFLYDYDLEKDEEILKNIPDWGDFLLSMQNKDKGSKRYGAFHYSYYLPTGEKENKFVVGTSALSIFSLLRLYDITKDYKYLESAILAGDWLSIMQNEDGTIRPYVRYSDGKWVYGTKESFLYEGQVLSALSKLYSVTGEKRYYSAAEKIAQRFAGKYEEEQGYIEDEYRTKNPISNSWVVMSSIDFYRISGEQRYKKVIFELSQQVLENQKTDPEDLLHYGRWNGAYSTSGTGWIGEVMAETYRFCLEQDREDCEKYKDAIVKDIRWIIQYTYSEENSFYLKNPDRAKGGSFWNQSNKYVRTDSVCHALNGFVRIMDYLEEGVLLSVPEKPLQETLGGLKS